MKILGDLEIAQIKRDEERKEAFSDANFEHEMEMDNEITDIEREKEMKHDKVLEILSVKNDCENIKYDDDDYTDDDDDDYTDDDDEVE